MLLQKGNCYTLIRCRNTFIDETYSVHNLSTCYGGSGGLQRDLCVALLILIIDDVVSLKTKKYNIHYDSLHVIFITCNMDLRVMELLTRWQPDP